MSHFTVLVPAEDRDELDRMLLPYHEYECTGIEEYTEWVIEHPADVAEEHAREFVNNKYVQENPKMKEKYEQYLEDGDIESIFSDWEGTEKDADGNFGRRTNPNAHWDWWSVGGRWTGLLRLIPTDGEGMKRNDREVAGMSKGEVDILAKMYLERPCKFNHVIKKYEGRSNEIAEHVIRIAEEQNGFIRPESAENGEPGVFGHVNTDPTRADTAFVEDVDWWGMYDKLITGEMETYYEFQANLLDAMSNPDGTPQEILAKATQTFEDDTRNCNNVFKSAEDYAYTMMAEEGMDFFMVPFSELADMFYMTPNEYRAKVIANSALTYAFIDMDGKWNQKAEMGWFGMSDPDGATEGYGMAFWEFIESLPDGTRVWVVDCHI